jgi:hypothetical protein
VGQPEYPRQRRDKRADRRAGLADLLPAPAVARELNPVAGLVAPETIPVHVAQLWLISRDGSWARQTMEVSSTVIQYGWRRLWEELESAHSEWEALGRPERQQLGLTFQQDGRHALWCGEPGNGVAELDG